jgi:hypothetical protein
MTEELIMITRLGSDEEVVDWFRAVRTANDAAGTPDEFPQLLREQAAAFDPAMVEEFLEALPDAGDGALAGLLELEDQMPGLYWAYNTQEEVPAEGDPFDWVDQDQASRLSAAWGNDWRTYLADQLSLRWSDGWQANPADHKQAWLTDLLPELLGESDEAERTELDEDPFGWLTDEQSARLASAWGGDWRNVLDEQLTARWGADWQSHPAEHKQAWFVDLLPELLPDAGELPADPGAQEAIPDSDLVEEPAETDDGDELWEEEVDDVMAELRAALIDTPPATTQEG